MSLKVSLSNCKPALPPPAPRMYQTMRRTALICYIDPGDARVGEVTIANHGDDRVHRALRMLVWGLTLALSSGCSPTFQHGLADDNQPEVDERLLGVWYFAPAEGVPEEAAQIPITVSRQPETKQTLVATWAEDQKEQRLPFQVYQAGKLGFVSLLDKDLDLSRKPAKPPIRRLFGAKPAEEPKVEKLPYVLGAYRLDGDELQVSFLKDEPFAQAIRAGSFLGTVGPKRRFIPQDVRVTATAAELRAFVTAQGEKLVEEDAVILTLTRQKPPPPVARDANHPDAPRWTDLRELPPAKPEEIDPRLVGRWEFSTMIFKWPLGTAGIRRDFNADGTLKVTFLVEGHEMGGMHLDWRLKQAREKASDVVISKRAETIEFLTPDRIRIGEDALVFYRVKN